MPSRARGRTEQRTKIFHNCHARARVSPVASTPRAVGSDPHPGWGASRTCLFRAGAATVRRQPPSGHEVDAHGPVVMPDRLGPAKELTHRLATLVAVVAREVVHVH